MATTTDSAPARVLDVTRLISRAGRGVTGVDRVERAYLAHFLRDETPFFALARTALGFVLLDRTGAGRLLTVSESDDWGRPDLLSRLSRRLDPARQAAQATLRRLALARAPRGGLGRMLARHMPAGTVYFNIGHSNLSTRVMEAVRTVRNARIAVLIHDTIPLDFPDYQRPGTVETFRGRLAVAGQYADWIITASEVVRASLLHHLSACPPVVVAPLGVTPPRPDPTAIPPGIRLDRPYFVTLGTIEPRKNHALLLDVWERLGDDPPGLVICGARGWQNEAVFARLDRGIPGVTEHSGVSDGAVAALLQGSRGLLFPSLAEGYGLPPIEAAALGVSVICGDLAIYRETLGDLPVYLSVRDSYLWENTIRRMATAPAPERPRPISPPGWQAHFNRALSPIGQLRGTAQMRGPSHEG
ncbi:MAG: glycosyltransferase [Limimaricola sp.]|uniref:glycosyltransferase family 4 protein n=1 Tax=Limimaricola sp. TaxID=2211665 RepID=UPI001E0756F2|nr:glycosyltransferase family 1 protein [Limimaricola sp.]MBI1417154.1 glycosyltransferase [Limimaricola sp.]